MWDRVALDTLPVRGTAVKPGDAGWSAYRGDMVLDGSPDVVVRPGSESEVADLIAHAAAHGIPVTAAGGQTSLTGSSVAESGMLLATERMQEVLDLHEDPKTGAMTAEAEPGIFLGDFQRRLEAEGWMYPPDPTSRNEARLGATVATNATGEDTLLYGPTRRWVRELRVVRADGSLLTLRRSPGSRPAEEKATPGYYHWGEPIDLLIGSEGTLGVITRITVDLVPRPEHAFAALAFFPNLRSALEFTVAARRSDKVTPRSLELVDRAALDLVGVPNPEGVTWPAATGAAIYFKQNVRDETDRGDLMTAWWELLEAKLAAAGAPALLDHVLVAEEGSGRDRLRAFRHRIPATLHETVRPFREHGGGKLGTDWWIPFPHIPDFLTGWSRRIAEAGLKVVIFGHIGNGHPHVNFLPRNAAAMTRARALVVEMCREAVALGGGVAGEHGLGKLKRDLLAIQYPGATGRIRAIKTEWDPKWILGRGNIVLPESGGSE